MLPFEHSLFMLVNANASTPNDVIELARWLSFVLPLCLSGAVIGALMFAPKTVQRDLLVAVGGLLLAALVAYSIRKQWPMPRPSQLGWGIQWIEHSGRAGFPSMHATIAFALAQGLLLAGHIRRMALGRLVIAAVWLCAIGIGWSRICLGVHTPSDVLGGVLVGVCAASLTAMAIRPFVTRMLITARGRSSAYSSHPAHP